MRNLKRVLSLALASVMLISMMVMGASAADKKASDLTDAAKITNKEAVTLLVDLKVIEGKTDGSYSPAEIVNRATMAKLITVMMMGDVDQSAFKGTSTDLTDINGHWAEGYIKYCYSNKIIAGDGQGHFFPDEPVTAVQAAKMLLVCIGYNASDRGYENNGNWSANIMKDAQTTTQTVYTVVDGVTSSTNSTRSLTKGISIKATDSLSRDNAAQMIFNTLFVDNQKPVYQWDNGKQYIQKYDTVSSIAVTTYNSLVRNSGTLSSVDTDNGFATIDGVGTLKLSAQTSDIGSTVVCYKDGSRKLISSAAVAAASNVVATSTKGTAFTKLTTKGETGYIGFVADDQVSLYVNGTLQKTDADSTGDADAADGIYEMTKTVDVTALKTLGDLHDEIGAKIEFIDNNDNGKWDTVKITEYTVSTITKTTAEKADGTEATITISGLSGSVKQSLVSGDFAGLAKDDVVIYAKVGTMFYVYEPETIEGKMSKYSTGSRTMTIDGTVYSSANLTNKTSMTGAQEFTGNGESKFYLDENGYVVVVDGIETETKYAAVDAIAWVTGSGTEATGYAEARLVFTDGTKATVQVATMGGKDVKKDTSTASYADGKVRVDVDDNKAEYQNCIYTYKINSKDKYELTRVAVDGSAALVKGTASIGDIATANNDTIYVYKTKSGSNDVLTAYTGYKNAPSTKAAATVSAATKGGYATFVFVDATGTTVGDDTSKMIVFLDDGYSVDNSGDDPIYQYSAAIDGEVDTYSAEKVLTMAVNTLYKVNVDNDGYITSPGNDTAYNFTDDTLGTAWTYAIASADAKAGSLKTNTDINSVVGATLTYDGSETVYLIGDEELTEGSAADIKAGTYFWVKTVDETTNAGKVAMKTVYVLNPSDTVVAAPATLAIAKASGTATISNSGNLLHADGVKVTSAVAGATFTVSAAKVDGAEVIITISGAGSTVVKSATDGICTTDAYTLVAGDIGAKLTINVISTIPGKSPTVNSYTVAVSA